MTTEQLQQHIHPISHNQTKKKEKEKQRGNTVILCFLRGSVFWLKSLLMTPRLHIMLWIYSWIRFYGIECKSFCLCSPISKLPMSPRPTKPTLTSTDLPPFFFFPIKPSSYRLSSLLPQKGKSAMSVALRRMRWPPAGTSHWPLWLERDLPRQSFSCREQAEGNTIK